MLEYSSGDFGRDISRMTAKTEFLRDGPMTLRFITPWGNPCVFHALEFRVARGAGRPAGKFGPGGTGKPTSRRRQGDGLSERIIGNGPV